MVIVIVKRDRDHEGCRDCYDDDDDDDDDDG